MGQHPQLLTLDLNVLPVANIIRNRTEQPFKKNLFES